MISNTYAKKSQDKCFWCSPPHYCQKIALEWFRQRVCCAIGLKLSQPAVSLSVKRGEKIAKENQYSLFDDINL
jgi:hypothetical protein